MTLKDFVSDFINEIGESITKRERAGFDLFGEGNHKEALILYGIVTGLKAVQEYLGGKLEELEKTAPLGNEVSPREETLRILSEWTEEVRSASQEDLECILGFLKSSNRKKNA